MTVSELIVILSGFNPDALVVMSSDSEGNNHSPIYGAFDNLHYIPDSAYSGEIRDFEQEEKDGEYEGYEKEELEELEEIKKSAIEAVLLCPTN